MNQTRFPSKTVGYVIVSLNVISSTFTCFFNVLVLVVIIKHRHLRCASNFLFCSLAASDLGIGLLVQPAFIVRVVRLVFYKSVNIDIIEEIFHATSLCFTGASLLTLVAMAIDRYLAVLLHLRYKVIVTTRRIYFAIASIWAAPLLAHIIFKTSSEIFGFVVIILIVLLSLFVTSYCYLKIFRITRYHRNQIKAQERSLSFQPGFTLPSSRRGRSITNMFYLHGFFCLCYLPFVVCFVMLISGPSTQGVVNLTAFTITWTYMNSCFNPLICCWRVKGIGEAVLTMITCPALMLLTNRSTTSNSRRIGVWELSATNT